VTIRRIGWCWLFVLAGLAAFGKLSASERFLLVIEGEAAQTHGYAL